MFNDAQRRSLGSRKKNGSWNRRGIDPAPSIVADRAGYGRCSGQDSDSEQQIGSAKADSAFVNRLNPASGRRSIVTEFSVGRWGRAEEQGRAATTNCGTPYIDRSWHRWAWLPAGKLPVCSPCAARVPAVSRVATSADCRRPENRTAGRCVESRYRGEQPTLPIPHLAVPHN